MGDNIDIEDITDESILAKLVRKHGKDSKVPLLMAIDAIGAGIDTTGNQASFLLYHLAKHPEVQEKLYDEIQACIAKDGSLTADSLMKMKYLKACQQESQRLLPVTSGVTRETQVEMVLGGYQIPSGTKVLIHSSSNCEERFPNSDKFVPERWLRGHSDQHTAHPFSHIPFGHGPRACIGQRFAKLELYVLMVKMIQRFHLEHQGEDVGVQVGLVGRPDRDVVLKILER